MSSVSDDKLIDRELLNVLRGGVKGWLLTKLLDDDAKERLRSGLWRAYKQGEQDGIQFVRSEQAKKDKRNWKVNYQEEWLCDACFEWIEPKWKHDCIKLNSSTKYTKHYRYWTVDENNRMTQMEKRR